MFAQFLMLITLLFGLAYCSKSYDLSDKKGFPKAADRALKQIIKEYNADPLYKEEVVGQLSDFKYMLHEVNLFGLKKCKATQLIFETKHDLWEEKFDCPQFILSFDYDVNGSFADIDVSGERGHMEISTGKVIVTIIGSYREFTKHGKTYIDIGNPMIETEAKDEVVMESNISNRNQTIADAAKAAFNGNFQDKAKQITEDVIDVVLHKFYDYLTEYLHSTSTDMTLK